MKKLDHPNLVSLIEVLDNPEEDSLYMVLEMCKKGVVMKVGLDENVTPYEEETCRYWFRDLILGIEYREYYTFLEPCTHMRRLTRHQSPCPGRHSPRYQAG